MLNNTDMLSIAIVFRWFNSLLLMLFSRCFHCGVWGILASPSRFLSAYMCILFLFHIKYHRGGRSALRPEHCTSNGFPRNG